jgi:hypothetical protein
MGLFLFELPNKVRERAGRDATKAANLHGPKPPGPDQSEDSGPPNV